MKSWLVLIIFLLVLSLPSPASTETNNYWQAIYFKHKFEDGQKANWYMDILLINEVVYPTLVNFEKQISVWRLHRRANRDKAGHQVRFLIYCQKEIADKAYKKIKENPVLAMLIESGDIIDFGYSNNFNLPNIEDTCDKNWTKDIQKTWPYYAMGASKMLSEQIALKVDQTASTLDNMKAQYKNVHKQITNSWITQGDHAYFHHLEALHGYNPLLEHH